MSIVVKGSSSGHCKKYELTDEHKLETYKSRKYEATFERVELAIHFFPGHDGKNAIAKDFIDAIKIHDEVVKQIEEKWIGIDALKKDLIRKTRLFRNLDATWNVLNQNPDDFTEYLNLIPRMKNIRERIKLMKNFKAKARAETELARFEELKPKCLKLICVHGEMLAAKDTRDTARKTLMEAEIDFNKLRAYEKEVAALITDDHIVADERKQPLCEFFPNVHMGFVIHSINGQNLSKLSYNECMAAIKRCRAPHKVDFRRYDYRYDPLDGIWRSLPEVRDLGTFVEDPLLTFAAFVQAAAAGDLVTLRRLLQQGEDPDSIDYTGVSALHAAAANGHLKICEILLRAGAKLDKRDINMMTPLLSVIRRGNVEIVWFMIEQKADQMATDIHGRGCVFYAVMSANPFLIKQFINTGNCNIADKIWGFTPLHLVAYQGTIETTKLLLQIGCNIYARDKQGRSAEQVARDANKLEIAALLEEERLVASAQLIYSNPSTETNIWIGDETSMNPAFCSLINVTHVIYLPRDSIRPNSIAWLLADETIQLLTVEIDADDDDDTNESWANLELQIPTLMHYLSQVLSLGSATILICDYSGNSTCVGVLTVALMLKYQTRNTETLNNCSTARPSVHVSMSILQGLEILQRNLDARKLKRLEDRTRNTTMGSCAF